MPICRTGHLRIHYQDIGKKSAPVLLLLHGWGHSWDIWSSWIPALSAHYRLIIPDLPGLGQSDGSCSGWNMFQYSQWLATFLNKTEISELHAVIGHSFGGKLFSFAWFAYENSLELPPVKKGFFAISPSGVVRPLGWLRQTIAVLLGAIPYTVKRRIFGRVRRFFYAQVLKETDYLNATAFQEDSLRKFLSEDITQAVSQPQKKQLHFAWGDKDTTVPIWMAYRFQSISETCDVFVVPNGDHFVHVTHPVLLQKWLDTWL